MEFQKANIKYQLNQMKAALEYIRLRIEYGNYDYETLRFISINIKMADFFKIMRKKN